MTEITEPAKQMAADLANAERERMGQVPDWTAEEFELGSVEIALTRLCARFIAMEAGMAEIHRRTDARGDAGYLVMTNALAEIRVIADSYRVEADPLLIEAREIVALSDDIVASNVRAGEWDNSHMVRSVLAGLKRGIVLGRAK